MVVFCSDRSSSLACSRIRRHTCRLATFCVRGDSRVEGAMMASSVSRWQCWFLLASIPCGLLIPRCRSDGGVGAGAAAAGLHGQTKRDAAAADIVARALVCFTDRYIYSGCQGAFRLGPLGALDVPRESADAFCGGPCLPETRRVLGCVDGIMDNFRFYNGASVGDVRFALDRGCGHSGLRGDFDVLRQRGGYGGDGYFYGRAGDVVSLRGNLVPPLLLTAAAAILV